MCKRLDAKSLLTFYPYDEGWQLQGIGIHVDCQWPKAKGPPCIGGYILADNPNMYINI